MKLKQIIIKLLNIDVYPVHTIQLNDVNSEISRRLSGRTTRLADMYIQLLFSTGRIIVVDHHKSELMHRHLRDIILRRLQIEHQGVRFDVRDNIIIMEQESLPNFKYTL